MDGLDILLAPGIQFSSPSEGPWTCSTWLLVSNGQLQHFELAANTFLHFNSTESWLMLTFSVWCKAQLFSFQMNKNGTLKARLATAACKKTIMTHRKDNVWVSTNESPLIPLVTSFRTIWSHSEIAITYGQKKSPRLLRIVWFQTGL